MGHLGYEQSWFEYLLAGEDVPERKPLVVAYEYIVSMSKLKPVDNYYVGDRVSADIMPAQSVGMNTILVGDQTGVADYTVSDFTEILNIL
jgi:FMN phosphatase YigB (HAD superfamily)